MRASWLGLTNIYIKKGAFTLGRQIPNVVLIANEAVKDYKLCKLEGFVFMIHFEKACDHVD